MTWDCVIVFHQVEMPTSNGSLAQATEPSVPFVPIIIHTAVRT